jgi:hypothetical protein
MAEGGIAPVRQCIGLGCHGSSLGPGAMALVRPTSIGHMSLQHFQSPHRASEYRTDLRADATPAGHSTMGAGPPAKALPQFDAGGAQNLSLDQENLGSRKSGRAARRVGVGRSDQNRSRPAEARRVEADFMRRASSPCFNVCRHRKTASNFWATCGRAVPVRL